MIIAAFLLTQCGLGYALRQPTVEGNGTGEMVRALGAPARAAGAAAAGEVRIKDLMRNYFVDVVSQDQLTKKVIVTSILSGADLAYKLLVEKDRLNDPLGATCVGGMKLTAKDLEEYRVLLIDARDSIKWLVGVNELIDLGPNFRIHFPDLAGNTRPVRLVIRWTVKFLDKTYPALAQQEVYKFLDSDFKRKTQNEGVIAALDASIAAIDYAINNVLPAKEACKAGAELGFRLEMSEQYVSEEHGSDWYLHALLHPLQDGYFYHVLYHGAKGNKGNFLIRNFRISIDEKTEEEVLTEGEFAAKYGDKYELVRTEARAEEINKARFAQAASVGQWPGAAAAAGNLKEIANKLGVPVIRESERQGYELFAVLYAPRETGPNKVVVIWKRPRIEEYVAETVLGLQGPSFNNLSSDYSNYFSNSNRYESVTTLRRAEQILFEMNEGKPIAQPGGEQMPVQTAAERIASYRIWDVKPPVVWINYYNSVNGARYDVHTGRYAAAAFVLKDIKSSFGDIPTVYVVHEVNEKEENIYLFPDKATAVKEGLASAATAATGREEVYDDSTQATNAIPNCFKFEISHPITYIVSIVGSPSQMEVEFYAETLGQVVTKKLSMEELKATNNSEFTDFIQKVANFSTDKKSALLEVQRTGHDLVTVKVRPVTWHRDVAAIAAKQRVLLVGETVITGELKEILTREMGFLDWDGKVGVDTKESATADELKVLAGQYDLIIQITKDGRYILSGRLFKESMELSAASVQQLRPQLKAAVEPLLSI